MKNKGLIALLTILFLAFLSIEQGMAQSKFLVKAGPTFTLGDGKYCGWGSGFEKQIGRKGSFSLTWEFLITSIPDSIAFMNDSRNHYYSKTFMESALTINPEFRFYKRKGILSLREGYFSGVGIEIGRFVSTRYNIEDIYTGNTRTPFLKSITREKGLLLMTRWSLGIAIHLKENLSLELSGGIKAGKVGKATNNNIIGLIPLVAKLRYAISEKNSTY